MNATVPNIRQALARRYGAALLVLALLSSTAAAQQSDSPAPATAPALPSPAAAAAEDEAGVPTPPVRPQVPYRNVTDEVVVFGRRDSLDLPDSIRTQIWRDQRREFEAMMLERERLSNSLARQAYDALFGSRSKVAILPGYNPYQERQIDYGVNDSTPAGVINLIGVGIGRKKD